MSPNLSPPDLVGFMLKLEWISSGVAVGCILYHSIYMLMWEVSVYANLSPYFSSGWPTSGQFSYYSAYCSHHHWGISSAGDGEIRPCQNFAQDHCGKAFLGYSPLALHSCQHTEEEAHCTCLLRAPGETCGRSLLSIKTLSKPILPLNGSFIQLRF